MRQAERSVLGCDYGGTSWTTKEQAQQIVEMLKLRSGLQLLDVGAGSGWPGLFLADTGGCDVTLLDMPLIALRKAQERALGDGTSDRVSVVAASGAEMPFRGGSFEAISHSDVLCCLPEKSEMLEECRRVATSDASMLFSVIAVAPSLSDSDRQRAIAAGPPFVDAPRDYADLISSAGWRLIERINVTAEHRRSLTALIRAFNESAELLAELGEDAVNEGRERRGEQIAAIDDGLLARKIFLVAAC